MEELGRAAGPAAQLGAALVNLALAPLPRRDAVAARLLDRVQGGQARVAVSFGELDPDPQAAALAWQGNALDGVLRFVDGAASATDLLVMTPDGFALVDLAQRGATVTPSRALGADGWCEVTLQSAPAESIALDDSTLRDLRLVAALLLLARAHGATRRAFEMVVEYAKERRQFGQPIGRFQAIQHKLANGLIALEGVRLTVEHAAESFDFRVADWRYFAQAAIAFGGPALRETALETQHAFGAIGYAEEHEAPRHFRRGHLDTLVLGGAREARRELAACLLDADDARLPEYDLGKAGNAFRTEVRAWLAEHWSGERKGAFDAKPFHDREFDASFALDLGKTGWLGLSWPRELGGQERTPLEQLAFIEVMERAEAPRFGAAVQANALIMFGTPEQRRATCPRSCAERRCTAWATASPTAAPTSHRCAPARSWTATIGSSTARRSGPPPGGASTCSSRRAPTATPSRRTRASACSSCRWTPPASRSSRRRRCTTAASRTSTTTTCAFRPTRIVGPVNGGWKVLTDALANERGLVGGGIVLKVAHGFDLLCRELRAAPALRDDALVRDRIGALAAEIEVGRRLMIHCAELATSGTTPPEMGAISKVYSGELMERYGEASLELLGPRAALSQHAPGALANGRFEQQLRHSLMWVISIGTNEIQRSLIAQRGLGLPR